MTDETEEINSLKNCCEIFGDFLKQKTCVDGNKFCFIMKKIIENSEIEYLNENFLNIKLVDILLGLRTYWDFKDLKVISIDNKMEEYICNKKICFRVDILAIHGETLILFENKFRGERSNNSDEAWRCVNYRKYRERTLNFLEINKPEIFSKIKKILTIGVGLDGYKDSEIEVNYSIHSIENINRNSYKTEEFIIEMKKGKKRFGENN